MKALYLSFFLIIVISCFNTFSYSQEANHRINNPDQPLFFTPKSHDPNFLKSAKFPDKSFYQRKSEWKHIIDTTWGPGAPLAEKLMIFNTYANVIHDKFSGFQSLKLNWDSLYNHYLNQINDSTSKGAFAAIMNHFAYNLKEAHALALDDSVFYTALNPGIPILLISSLIDIEHFGAVTTILPDSATLILRVAPNHPLNLQPGDIILGYEGIPWKNLVKELFNAGIPFIGRTGGCKSADTYHNLMGAGMNWHLFSTIDILKYSTGDTLHQSLEPMLTLKLPSMSNNEQLPIKNIPFPNVVRNPNLPYSDVTYGILENTNIGYIFLSNEKDFADNQFFNAVNSLKNTDALIIDMRMNHGGWALLNNGLDILFNEFNKTLADAFRCNTSTFYLCPQSNWASYQIAGNKPDYFDKPIAVLLGPSSFSMGDINAYRIKYHPMVRFFGKSSHGSLGGDTSAGDIKNWWLHYPSADMYHTNDPGNYLERKEFPIDFPVWFNKDDVAKGIDPIVEKAKEWINNLAYGHSLVLNKMSLMTEKDTIHATAIIENPESHDLSAMLIIESIDKTVVDSTQIAQSAQNQE
ncbi:MAG: S41 family peptidase, partial [Methylococcaceae bacterium]